MRLPRGVLEATVFSDSSFFKEFFISSLKDLASMLAFSSSITVFALWFWFTMLLSIFVFDLVLGFLGEFARTSSVALYKVVPWELLSLVV